jgi:hypothetical protein
MGLRCISVGLQFCIGTQVFAFFRVFMTCRAGRDQINTIEEMARRIWKFQLIFIVKIDQVAPQSLTFPRQVNLVPDGGSGAKAGPRMINMQFVAGGGGAGMHLAHAHTHTRRLAPARALSPSLAASAGRLGTYVQAWLAEAACCDMQTPLYVTGPCGVLA